MSRYIERYLANKFRDTIVSTITLSFLSEFSQITNNLKNISYLNNVADNFQTTNRLAIIRIITYKCKNSFICINTMNVSNLSNSPNFRRSISQNLFWAQQWSLRQSWKSWLTWSVWNDRRFKTRASGGLIAGPSKQHPLERDAPLPSMLHLPR